MAMGTEQTRPSDRNCFIPREDMPDILSDITGCITIGPIKLPRGEYYVGELSTMLSTSENRELELLRRKKGNRDGC